MFGGEGPIMQGTWYNPHTGDAFTVRDSFFEDNQYVVTTTDGRYIRYDQLQNYVQSDMKLEDLKKMKIDTTPAKEEIPAEVAGLIDDPYADMLLPEDVALTQPKLGNLYKDDAKVYDTPVGQFMTARNDIPSGNTMNDAIIEKALKNTARPDFNIDVVWDNFPKKEIEMLNEIMDIPVDEIIDWYLDNIDIMDVVLVLKNSIKDKILHRNETVNNELFEALRNTNNKKMWYEPDTVINTMPNTTSNTAYNNLTFNQSSITADDYYNDYREPCAVLVNSDLAEKKPKKSNKVKTVKSKTSK